MPSTPTCFQKRKEASHPSENHWPSGTHPMPNGQRWQASLCKPGGSSHPCWKPSLGFHAVHLPSDSHVSVPSAHAIPLHVANWTWSPLPVAWQPCSPVESTLQFPIKIISNLYLNTQISPRSARPKFSPSFGLSIKTCLKMHLSEDKINFLLHKTCSKHPC